MRIIGIDPGLARVGYGLIEVINNNKKLLDCGIIETKKGIKEEIRLFEIYEDLKKLTNEWHPDLAAVEKFFFYKSSTPISVVQARGVIMMTLGSLNIPISEYAPAQIKLAITGSGKATKQEVLNSVMLSLNLKNAPKPDDSADALAIALTKLYEMNF